MNVTNSGLDFALSATDDDFRKVLKGICDELDATSQHGRLTGKAVAASYDQTKAKIQAVSSAIEAQNNRAHDALKKLEAELSQLSAQKQQATISGASPAELAGIQAAIQAKEQERQKWQQVQTSMQECASETERVNAKLEQHRAAAETASQAQGSMRTQLRACVQEMARLEAEQGPGVRQTKAFQDLQREAGRLTDAMGDARTQAQIFSHDNPNLQGIISGIGGLAGAFSAAQGVVALFGAENEDLQRIMLKVQGAMAIANGLQTVANTLNKDSAFMLTTVRKAKELLTVATNKLSVALGVSNVAAKALMATLTLGVSVAITALIMAWDKFSASSDKAAESTNKAREAFDEYHKQTATKSADLVGKYQQLRAEYAKLKTAAEKQAWLKENAKEFDSLGLSVTGVTSADNVFIANTANVVKALELRAKAMALQDMQTKAYQQYYESIVNADSTVTGGGYHNVYKPHYKSDAYGAIPEALKGLRAGTDYNVVKPAGWDGVSALDIVVDVVKANARSAELAKQRNDKARAEAVRERDKVLGTVQQLQKEVAAAQAATGVQLAGGSEAALNGKGGAKSGGKTGGKSGTDSFDTALADKKKSYDQYKEWATSADEGLRASAEKLRQALDPEGATYLDYLKGQRAKIEAIQNKSTSDLKHLATLNDAIAAEVGSTLIPDYTKSLDEQLKKADTLGAQLSIIEAKRKEIEGDRTEVGDAKREVLTTTEDKVKEQIKSETQEALQQYAAYELERIKFQESYARRRELLAKQSAEATTEQERQVALKALERLETEKEKYTKRGNESEQYAAMVEKYKGYEQQVADVRAKYDAERAEAKKQNNDKMLAQIDAAEQKELSTVAATALQATEEWRKLFSNLDDLSVKAIQKLIKAIDGQKLNLDVVIGEDDLKGIKDKLEEAANKIREKNPFAALFSADQSFKDAAKNTAGVLSSVNAVYSSAVDGIKTMGIELDEGTQAAMEAVSGLLNGIESLTMAMATNNPVGMITASVGLLATIVGLFNFKDRKLEKQVKNHQKAVNALKTAYNELNDAVARALGEDKVTTRQPLIENLRRQQGQISAMMAAEEAKKKTDKDRLNDWQDQFNDIGRQIKDIMEEITQDITQTTATDLASSLADALVSAFSDGKDAAKAFGDVANDVIKNAVTNALKLQFLEKPLQAAIARLQKDMGFDEEGNGTFDGLTESEQQAFRDSIAAAGANFQTAMDMYKDLFKQLDDTDPTTLSGAIQGASQESIDLLAGQTNAVRQNQVTALEVMRSQLAALTGIRDSTRTAADRLLMIYNELTAPNGALRSQGITD